MNINKKFIVYNYTKRTQPVKYIVVHDVGAKGSTAMNNYNYFNGGNRGSSADFFVDTKETIQTVDYIKNYSWHCGDGKGKYGITNNNSVGIEMCLVEPYDKVIDKTIELIKHLMQELNIPIERVVRHYDASRKNCPGSLSAANWKKWYEFKERLIMNKYSYDNTVNGLVEKGITDVANMAHWEKVLDGREPINKDEVRTLFDRLLSKIK